MDTCFNDKSNNTNKCRLMTTSLSFNLFIFVRSNSILLLWNLLILHVRMNDNRCLWLGFPLEFYKEGDSGRVGELKKKNTSIY
jgi:hypothetical protein